MLEGRDVRDTAVIAAALGLVTALGWLYLFAHAASMDMPATGGMGGMVSMRAPSAMPAHPGGAVHVGPLVSTGMSTESFSRDVAALSVMWAVMMVAMMAPSAAPMIAIFTRVHRRRAEAGRPTVPTGVFAIGYVVAWGAFSVVAAAGQALAQRAAWLSPAMATTHDLLTGVLLVVAGAFQWTPLKRACLSACRSPLSFVMSSWRDGAVGALRMGMKHGLYCVGCCWALMLLLFVVGVMSLPWVAAVAAAVLAEKVAPRGDLIAKVVGAGLVGAGVFVTLAGRVL